MKNTINSKQKIGEIATICPKAIDIFMEYEIDFCCGGDRILENALEEQNVNENEIINKLNVAYEEFRSRIESDTDWNIAKMSDLIDYIVDKHHRYMKEEMPITEKLLNKILKVHYVDHGSILSKLNKLFNNLKIDIDEHLIKEEEILFPLIKKYENNPTEENLNEVIKVMNETEDEHEAAGDILKEMRKLTNGFKAPENGCNTFIKTYEKIEAIEKDLFNHIHLENNILFERLKK